MMTMKKFENIGHLDSFFHWDLNSEFVEKVSASNPPRGKQKQAWKDPAGIHVGPVSSFRPLPVSDRRLQHALAFLWRNCRCLFGRTCRWSCEIGLGKTVAFFCTIFRLVTFSIFFNIPFLNLELRNTQMSVDTLVGWEIYSWLRNDAKYLWSFLRILPIK